MEDEDRKILTEFLGECWFDVDNFDSEGICKICGECWEAHHHYTFDTWEDFGALWDGVVCSNKLLDFLDEIHVPDDEIYDMRSGVGELLKHIVDIDRFPFLVIKAIKKGILK